jgi:disulfide oxidoreductase YuzD
LQHGSKVQVEYVDMQLPAAQTRYAEVLKTIQERDLPYPLVAIDGQLRLAGSANYYHILPLVEQAIGHGGKS